MYSYPGTWKSFDELESCLALKEVVLLLDTAREQQQLNRKFAAAIQGIDIDKESNNGQSDFDRVKERALAKATGRSEDEIALDGLFNIEDEGDDLE